MKVSTALSKRVAMATSYFTLFSLTLILSSFSNAAHSNAENKTLTTVTNNSNAIPSKEWTVLVYLNGHNNLDQFGFEDINEMETVGSTEHFNVVVQWASLENGNTRRILVKKDHERDTVTSPTIQELAPVDMGDKNELAKFIEWGHANFPAKHYFVVIWNHGSGWRSAYEPQVGGAARARVATRDISYDDLTSNQITTEGMGWALEKASRTIGHKIDIYGSDACLMGMVEIAQQLAPSTQYFIGSQEVEPGEGWPYDVWLNLWRSQKLTKPEDVAKALVKSYSFSYGARGEEGLSGVTLSAIDLSKISALTTSLRALKSELLKLPADQLSKLMNALDESQKFDYYDFVDIKDFIIEIKKQLGSLVDHRVISAVDEALYQSVLINRTQSGYSRSRGLSIWLTSDSSIYSPFLPSYKELEFSKLTGWEELLGRLTEFVDNGVRTSMN